MNTVAEQILERVKPLIGLKLSYARRAADMRNFGFGKIREVVRETKRGTKIGSMAEYALHVECPWRIESSEGIVTGRHDLWEPSELIEGEEYKTWDYSDGNMQDVLITELFGDHDPDNRWYINQTQFLYVEDIKSDDYGGLTLSLSGGYRLVLFPAGSRSESWRFFGPESQEQHFVISGGRVEEY